MSGVRKILYYGHCPFPSHCSSIIPSSSTPMNVSSCCQILFLILCPQGSAGLTSQPGGGHRQHSYASITSQGTPSPEEVPSNKSHASHVTSPIEPHDQRPLYSMDDEDDDLPPNAHTVTQLIPQQLSYTVLVLTANGVYCHTTHNYQYVYISLQFYPTAIPLATIYIQRQYCYHAYTHRAFRYHDLFISYYCFDCVTCSCSTRHIPAMLYNVIMSNPRSLLYVSHV